MLQYIDIKPNDALLDVGGNTGKKRGSEKRNHRKYLLGGGRIPIRLDSAYHGTRVGLEGVSESLQDKVEQ